MREFVIRHKQSTSYYPQGNGQAESTNRILLTSLRKLVADDPKHWDQELPSVLWAFRTAYKVTTGATPFQLAYGLEAIMPWEFTVPSLRTALSHKLGDEGSLRERLAQLEHLDEARREAMFVAEAKQRQRAEWHRRRTKLLTYQPGDWVLKLRNQKDKEQSTGKFKTGWKGPYRIGRVFENGTVLLEKDGAIEGKPINGNRLRPYRC
jgi:hypothetical protein